MERLDGIEKEERKSTKTSHEETWNRSPKES